MTIVTTSSTLPALDSPRIEELRLSERPHCRSAYHTILRAERHDVEQQANEDIVSTRVAGYILLEFHAQSDFFGGRAWASIAPRVTSLPLGTLVVMNTVSSSMPRDCSVTNLSGCVRSTGSLTLLYAHGCSEVRTCTPSYLPPFASFH